MPSDEPHLLDAADGSGLLARPLLAVIEEALEAQHDLELQLRSRFSLNPTDFRALLLVRRRRRRGLAVHPKDLTRAFGVSSGATAQIIGRLTAAELLVRADDPDDARAGLLELSATATDRLNAATAELQHDLDGVISALEPDEERRLVALLDQVRDVFHAHRLAGTASAS